MEHVPRVDHRSPHTYRVAMKNDMCVSAGVTSDNLAEMNVENVRFERENIHQYEPIFKPPTHTDPINHEGVDCHEGDTRCKKSIEGAAGVRTDRVTQLNLCVMTTQPTLTPAETSAHNRRSDPISHSRASSSANDGAEAHCP